MKGSHMSPVPGVPMAQAELWEWQGGVAQEADCHLPKSLEVALSLRDAAWQGGRRRLVRSLAPARLGVISSISVASVEGRGRGSPMPPPASLGEVSLWPVLCNRL